MKEPIESMEYRYNVMAQNGRNIWGHGIMRKLYYKIIQAKEAVAKEEAARA